MSGLGTVHGQWVHPRRLRVLAGHFSRLLPQGASVLDVGCGDGHLAHLVQQQRPDLRIEGIDVLVRPRTAIPVRAFDGRRLPCADNSVDVVMMSDVLHHTPDPMVLLRESARVTRRGVALKDHFRDGLLAQSTLRFMDWVGNRRHGVALPYQYLSAAQWDNAFQKLQLKPVNWVRRLGLYPWPANWVFERNLHFIVWLEKTT